jgi:hypothetical protein
MMNLTDANTQSVSEKEIVLDAALQAVAIEPYSAADIGRFNVGITKGKMVVRDAITGTLRHQNYLEYLAAAWKNHRGIVVSPDLLWHIVLNETAQHIKANAEKYRDLFTKSTEKVEIRVQTGDPELLPLPAIMAELEKLVPTSIALFRPEFSTSTDASRLAMMATFADAMSPFYNYSMYMCGIPKVKVLGTEQDWNRFLFSLNSLTNIIPTLMTYYDRVSKRVREISDETSPEFWAKMFSLKRCGSGSQVEVEGWINSFYVKRPRPAYVNNYPTCVSYVDYKNLDNGKAYQLVYGLFGSNEVGDYLVPEYGYLITIQITL